MWNFSPTHLTFKAAAVRCSGPEMATDSLLNLWANTVKDDLRAILPLHTELPDPVPKNQTKTERIGVAESWLKTEAVIREFWVGVLLLVNFVTFRRREALMGNWGNWYSTGRHYDHSTTRAWLGWFRILALRIVCSMKMTLHLSL